MTRFMLLCLMVLAITLKVAWAVNRLTNKGAMPMTLPTDDADDIQSLHLLQGYLTNDGLDTFLSTAGAREWEMDRFRRVLDRVGASAVWPIIQQAEQASAAYHEEADRTGVPTASTEGQVRVKAYLAHMYDLDARIDALGFNFGALADRLKAQK